MKTEKDAIARLTAQLYRLGDELAEAQLQIAALQAKLEAAHEDVRALKDTLNLVYAVLQKGNKTTWGDTLLYAISTALARPTVRKIVEGT